jgi:hypothetical protein
VNVLLKAYFPSISYYTILLYFLAIISFIIYGWLFRRWFVKNRIDKKDQPLKNVFLFFLPFYFGVGAYSLTVYFSSLNTISVLTNISITLLELIQFSLFGILVGIFMYSRIEKHLGLLFYNEILIPDKSGLGIESAVKQAEYSIRTKWNNLMLFIGLSLLLANLLVFIIYPSIPASSRVETLIFTFPNLDYRYNPSTGFRQDFFRFIELPKSIIVDWKLAQSLMSLALFGVLFLLIYLPKDKKADEKISKEDKFLEEDTLDNIAFNILNQEINYEGYIPSEKIIESKKSRFSKFISTARKSDLIPVVNLLCLNIALSTLLITILMNLGVPIIGQISIDLDQFYVEMSRAFWAGFHEEITYRWILFGLPLFVLNGLYFIFIKFIQSILLRGKRENKEKSKLVKFLLERKLKNPLLYLTGRWKKFGFFDFAFLIFSSFCFGYVHYHPGNWLEGKIFQAAVAGLIFGYAFYKYGLHAAIFLHVANNFIVGMVITPNLGLILNGGFLYFLTILLGSFVLIFALFSPLSSMFKFLNRKLGRINKEGYIASNKKT